MEFPIERPRPDPRRYYGIPHGEPGFTNMLCPTEHRLTQWEILKDDRLRCTECGRNITRDEAIGKEN